MDAERLLVRMSDITLPYGFSFQGGHRDPVLDLACTKGTNMRALAAAVGQGHVLGLSSDPRGGMLPAQAAQAVAQAFGRVPHIVTCTGSMSHTAMARTLSAVVESGVWCCIDRLDALRPEVLSQLAQQIHEASLCCPAHEPDGL